MKTLLDITEKKLTTARDALTAIREQEKGQPMSEQPHEHDGPKPPPPAETAKRDHFQRLYGRWLKARPHSMDPDQDMDEETCEKKGQRRR